MSTLGRRDDGMGSRLRGNDGMAAFAKPIRFPGSVHPLVPLTGSIHRFAPVAVVKSLRDRRRNGGEGADTYSNLTSTTS